MIDYSKKLQIILVLSEIFDVKLGLVKHPEWTDTRNSKFLAQKGLGVNNMVGRGPGSWTCRVLCIPLGIHDLSTSKKKKWVIGTCGQENGGDVEGN